MNIKNNQENLIIIGSGTAGKLLTKEIRNNPILNYNLLGFLDDFKKKGSKIIGLPIFGKISDLQNIIEKYNVKKVIIAIPSLKKERFEKIISLCGKVGIKTLILPPSYESLYSLKTGRPWIREPRPININDLLRRDIVKADFKGLKETISNKNILVTGGGGSIGRELCMQLAELSPKNLLILDNCEYNLYKIDLDLRDKYGSKLKTTPIIGDIKDKRFIDEIFDRENIDIVFHVAAYKHVPIMESNIRELVKNNIFGTYNVACAAEKNMVKKFILVSTDKVVNPTSVMGVSKKIAEIVLSLFGNNTEYITVRFGNVLGSVGSIIPLFEEQIKKGGPVTITHPKIKRYFMTIPEAAQLILQASSIGKDKNVLILDMGKQYLIKDIAEKLIQLHGFEPHKDIKLRYIGLRPGDKLLEELWTEKEKVSKTSHKRIFMIKLEKSDKKKIRCCLKDLSLLVQKGDIKGIKIKFKELVPSYQMISLSKASSYQDNKDNSPKERIEIWKQKGRK